jgi:hypothetical protein
MADDSMHIAGFKRFSVVRLLGSQFFKNQIEGFQTRSKLHQIVNAISKQSSKDHSGAASAHHGETSQALGSLNEALTEYTSQNVKPQLKILYGWAQSVFSALDLGGKGMISITEDGPTILQGLHAGGMKHLYHILLEMSAGNDFISLEKFTPIFFSWMGVDDAFEARVRVGMFSRAGLSPYTCALDGLDCLSAANCSLHHQDCSWSLLIGFIYALHVHCSLHVYIAFKKHQIRAAS